MVRVLTYLACMFFTFAAHAVTIESPLPDAAQEQVARAVIRQLNCVVCEGQALADSDAQFARDMRLEIRRLAGENKTEQDILTYFRSRYGDTILLNPPLQQNTLPLWLAPLVLVAIGALWLWRFTRRRATT